MFSFLPVSFSLFSFSLDESSSRLSGFSSRRRDFSAVALPSPSFPPPSLPLSPSSATLPQHRLRLHLKHDLRQDDERKNKDKHAAPRVHPPATTLVARRPSHFVSLRRAQARSWTGAELEEASSIPTVCSSPVLVSATRRVTPPFFHIASFHSSCPLRGAVQSDR
jgi:hypothetical protein